MSTPANNTKLLGLLGSKDPGMLKTASDGMTDYIRAFNREDGILPAILPPQQLSDSDLNVTEATDKPVKYVEIEPGSPGAVTVPFATLGEARYIRGKRFPVMFQRVMGPKYNKDISELRTYQMDIRQILSDNSLKDMLTLVDGRFLTACNIAMGGSSGATAPSGVIQWGRTTERIHRTSIPEMRKLMQRTDSRNAPRTALINAISVNDVLKWGRDEVGGTAAQDWLLNGISKFSMFGMDWIVTIKSNLVKENSIWGFSDPKFFGKNYTLTPLTMSVDVKDFMVSWFPYMEIGTAVIGTRGVCRLDFKAATSTAGIDDNN